MFRDLREGAMNSGQMRTIIMERIAGDVMNQMVRMDVDHVEGLLHPGAPGKLDEATPDGLPPVYQEERANSLGYSPMQGAIGKNGADKGKGFGKDHKGGGGGKSYGGKDQKGKDGGQGAGKGERPVGACSHCWGFGHYYRACPVRLGPEAAAQAEKDYAIAVAKGDKGKGKGKAGKGKGQFAKKGVYGVEGFYGAEESGGDPLAWAEEQ